MPATVRRKSPSDRFVDADGARALARFARRVLKAANQGHTHVSISLVGDAEIHSLNRIYRAVDRPTDVLSFSQREGPPIPNQDHDMLGDIVVSVETAARRRKRALDAELRHLVVHGICHLLGWDHGTRQEARRMFAYERRLHVAASHALK